MQTFLVLNVLIVLFAILVGFFTRPVEGRIMSELTVNKSSKTLFALISISNFLNINKKFFIFS